MNNASNNQTICLNMIVKNEAHIIKNTLLNIISKIKINYWVISDTGSTDNTCEIIKLFFKENKILGELHHDEWKDFGYNRTLALKHAYKKTDYLFIFDADDKISGDLILPQNLDQSAYNLSFGNANTHSYKRPLLINNSKKWQYIGVLHEYLDGFGEKFTNQPITGDYFIISGRTGNRSSDPEKYFKDAIVLEKAYNEMSDSEQVMLLKARYAFYCANSYFDYGNFDKASEWYKITLSQKGWNQEKYISCFKLYKCFKRLEQRELSLFYLVKSYDYDNERVECIYKLAVHYCLENKHDIAYNYYSLIKDYYENKFLINDTHNKLFIDNRVTNFYLPYYMIIISENQKKYETGIKMYQIIFLKKTENVYQQQIGNILYNFQFFLNFLNELKRSSPDYVSHFYELFNSYLEWLVSNKFNLKQYDFLDKYKDLLNQKNKLYLTGDSISLTTDSPSLNDTTLSNINLNPKFTNNDCKNSKNILFFAGFGSLLWNYTYGLDNALGGSERAVNYLSSTFPKDYNIYVSGNVKEEVVGNVHYIHLFKLKEFLQSTCFHTIIVSRYIGFFELYNESYAYNSFIWVHDTQLTNYGSGLNPTQILEKWNDKITGAICLTEWHKGHIANHYPILKDKIHIINNGIAPGLFVSASDCIKIKNLFIYTSCPERGLNKLLEFWPKIIDFFPDAKLKISSYNDFPANDADNSMQKIIKSYPSSIEHCGKLKPADLYKLMAQAEYWLYPTNWPETSCITALEMLNSGVICLYHPCAGLTDTMGKYGIQLKEGDEINTLVKTALLPESKKNKMIADGREYALSCSWDNKAKIWNDLILKVNEKKDAQMAEKKEEKNVIELNTNMLKKKIVICPPTKYADQQLSEYITNLKTIYDIEYTNNLQTIISFNPQIIIFIIVDVEDHFEPVHNYFKDKNIELSILNLEPLNISARLNVFLSKIVQYKFFKIYDYSLSNIKILNNRDFKNTAHLPYIVTDKESDYLKDINNAEKTFDFGLINWTNPPTPHRRQTVVEHLKKHGYTVNIVMGWGVNRDKELAKCKIILNIHGFYHETSRIFEHIRCDRLLGAGFKILSEDSYELSTDFIEKYKNLRIIKYDDFLLINSLLKDWL